MNIYLGIDPGDKWVGFARMQVSNNQYVSIMGVYNSSLFNLHELVDYLLDNNCPTHVITESFQHRPLGHNAFGRGTTLRLIGALQYATAKQKLIWGEVMPGNAATELGHLHLGKYIDKWMPHLPSDSRWQHAHSAWRVIGRYLLTLGHPDITRLARSGKNPPMVIGHVTASEIQNARVYERHPLASMLLAPAASWTV